jgi:hypothetical protein
MFSGIASAESIGLRSTGFSSGGSLLSGGLADGNWRLSSDPLGSVSTPMSPVVTIQMPGAAGGWLADNSNSEWISPHTDERNSVNPDPPGVYIYQQTFNVGFGNVLSTVLISGQWAADNKGYIEINGVQVAPGAHSGAITSTLGYQSFTSFALDSSNVSNFHFGLNTIEFVVTNTGANNSGTGLNVNIQSASVAPEPASLACIGAGLGLLALFAGKRLKTRA